LAHYRTPQNVDTVMTRNCFQVQPVPGIHVDILTGTSLYGISATHMVLTDCLLQKQYQQQRCSLWEKGTKLPTAGAPAN